MNSCERIEAAFAKQPADMVPINHRGFSGKMAELILKRDAYVGGSRHRWAEATAWWEGWHDEFEEQAYQDAVAIARATGQDLIRPSYWGEGRKPTAKLDDNTFLFAYGPERDWQVLKYVPECEDVTSLPYITPGNTVDDVTHDVEKLEALLETYAPTEAMFQSAIRCQREYGQDYAVECGGASIGVDFSRIAFYLEAMVTHPDLIRRLIAAQVEMGRRNIRFLAGFGLKYLTGGTDFCSEIGPMYSPALFREFVRPGLVELCDECHRHGMHYLFASDGNLWPVADEVFAGTGVDAFFEIDRKAGMDLETLRQRYSNMTLIGNLSSWTLARGTTQDVIEEVQDCCRVARQYGGVVVGCSNAVQPDTPEDNLWAMMETIERLRKNEQSSLVGDQRMLREGKHQQ